MALSCFPLNSLAQNWGPKFFISTKVERTGKKPPSREVVRRQLQLKAILQATVREGGRQANRSLKPQAGNDPGSQQGSGGAWPSSQLSTLLQSAPALWETWPSGAGRHFRGDPSWLYPIEGPFSPGHSIPACLPAVAARRHTLMPMGRAASLPGTSTQGSSFLTTRSHSASQSFSTQSCAAQRVTPAPRTFFSPG